MGYQWIQVYERDTAAYGQTVKDSMGAFWLVNDPDCQFCRYLVAARRRSPGISMAGKYVIAFHDQFETGWSKVFRHQRGFSHSLFEVYITVLYPQFNTFPFDPPLDAIICHINKPVKMARSPQIVSPVFNVSLVESWLEACNDQRHPRCTTDYENLQMPKTRLIDCSTRKLISVGGGTTQRPRFVALSYVWGEFKNEDTQMGDCTLPSKCPLTIEDAMIVTTALKFQYLWVDQYCVDQSDSDDRKRQIRHMDLIYKCADLTIIAGAGSDCNYGLPGVSDRARDVPEPFILDDVLTFGILPLRRNHWECGSWHTRGWTFQEAHLSRRRLVFSDTAVHFECMKYKEWQIETSGGVECEHMEAVEECGPVEAFDAVENCDSFECDTVEECDPFQRCDPYEECEPFEECNICGESFSISEPISVWDQNEPVVGRSLLSRPANVYEYSLQPVHHKTLEASIRSYTDLVAQYTRRTLTYPSDGLNAFRGAANALSNIDPPVYNVAGIPFVVYGDGEYSLAEATFSYGLAWRSSAGGLDPGTEFPSWSWGNVRVWDVSWTPSKRYLERFAASAVGHPRGVRIEFKANESKELVELVEFVKACQASMPLSQRIPTALCFKARILSSQVAVFVFPEEANYCCEFWGTFHGDLETGGNLWLLLSSNNIPGDERNKMSDGARKVIDIQQRCLVRILHQKLYEKLVSERYSLMLLRCDSRDAQILVIEWRDVPCEPQKTARRIGIVEFERGPAWRQTSFADVFLYWFSIETDLRLI